MNEIFLKSKTVFLALQQITYSLSVKLTCSGKTRFDTAVTFSHFNMSPLDIH